MILKMKSIIPYNQVNKFKNVWFVLMKNLMLFLWIVVMVEFATNVPLMSGKKVLNAIYVEKRLLLFTNSIAKMENILKSLQKQKELKKKKKRKIVVQSVFLQKVQLITKIMNIQKKEVTKREKIAIFKKKKI